MEGPEGVPGEARGPGEILELDLRDLEAPEPMHRTLEAAARLAPGESLVAHTPCYPRPLLAELARRELPFEAREEPDGSGWVRVRRPG